MHLEVRLTSDPIPAAWPVPAAARGAGAWIEFRGVVRGEENGQPIAALEYEAYAPMAEREMRRILDELAREHPCLAARVVHRVGLIPVGEAAIYVGVAGRHRAEALALLAAFMDRLKQDVPIWKRRALAAAALAGQPGTRPGGADFQTATARVFNPPTAVAAPEPRPSKVGGTAGGETCAPARAGMVPPAGSTSDRPASADEVRELVRSLCRPLEPERVPLPRALGRVLREPVRAPEDLPPFDRSAVDGFAVRLDDPAEQFQVVDEIRAGDWKPRSLHPGEAVRLATGGALPDDGLQVLLQEDTRLEGDRVMVLRRERARNIRFRGEDARAGGVLVEAGTVLGAGALGLLASAGCAEALVSRVPRAVHLVTGNEIVPPEQAPAPGQIRDSNSALVRGFLASWGVVPVQRRLPEDAAALATALEDPSLAETDLLLISGGASVGRHDFTRRALETAGFVILVSKTTARPGKPLIVAQRGATLAFGLPGNPLAHFVCLHLYVRAALEAWSGPAARNDFTLGTLAADLPAEAHDRETFWPARWQLAGGEVGLMPLHWRSSGDLTALAAANALLRLPAGAGTLGRGSRVEFLRTDLGP